MIVVNFSHPLTAEQQATIGELAGSPIERVVDVPTHFDEAVPFADQIAGLVGAAGLSAAEWQTAPLLVNLPSYAPIAAALLAYLHGVCGHFPSVVRLRPKGGAATPMFEVAEILNLNDLRLNARRVR